MKKLAYTLVLLALSAVVFAGCKQEAEKPVVTPPSAADVEEAVDEAMDEAADAVDEAADAVEEAADAAADAVEEATEEVK